MFPSTIFHPLKKLPCSGNPISSGDFLTFSHGRGALFELRLGGGLLLVPTRGGVCHAGDLEKTLVLKIPNDSNFWKQWG